MKSPRVCTRDVNEVRGQVLGGTIFGEQDRAGIWARVQAVDDLIPSLDALFKNLSYLKVLADCMTRLVRLLPAGTVSVLFKAFSDTNQRSLHYQLALVIGQQCRVAVIRHSWPAYHSFQLTCRLTTSS